MRISLSYATRGRFPDNVAISCQDKVVSVSGRIPTYHFFSLIELFKRGWRLIPIDDGYVLLYNEKESVRIKYAASGLHVTALADIFLNEIYGKAFKNMVVVDIGMANGDSSIFFAKKGARLVIGLEPNPSSFNLAKENIELNGVEDIVVPLNLALSRAEGRGDLRVASRAPFWSTMISSDVIKQPKEMIAWFDALVTVQTTTLDALMQHFSLDRIDLLKFNCEGCEHEVILSAADDTLSRVSEVIMEFHGDSSNIQSRLKSLGFRVAVLRGNQTLGILDAKM